MKIAVNIVIAVLETVIECPIKSNFVVQKQYATACCFVESGWGDFIANLLKLFFS